MVNLNELVAQAQTMQAKVKLAQGELEKQIVSGISGGGLVKITMTCTKEPKTCEINPYLLDPKKKEDLEDLIVAAFLNAKQNADEISLATMEDATEGLQLPPGVELPL